MGNASTRSSAVELAERVDALRPLLVSTQADTERLGRYPQEVHQAFLDNDLYRILEPARYGGLELGLDAFFRVVMGIARGNPGAAWCFSLGAGHALPMASYFTEQAQAEVFGGLGPFIAPHRNQGGFGTATQVDGGYRVSARFDYCSGVPYSTYLMGTTLVGSDGEQVPQPIVVVLRREDYTVLDNWGDGSILGMQGSGSNSVIVDDVFVPEHRVVPYDWTDHLGPTPGTQLHGNPMYLGRLTAFYAGEVVSVAVGTARAALDEFERIITTRKTMKAPYIPRYQHYDFQRAFGLALTMTDAAESILLHTASLHAEHCSRWAQDGTPFTAQQDTRLRGRVHQAGQLAADAVELLFRSAGSSAAAQGQAMQRYYRDISVFKTHPTAAMESLAVVHARTYFEGLDGESAELI